MNEGPFAEDVAVDLVGAPLTERQLERLEPILTVDEAANGEGRTCTIDIDRLLRAMTLYEAVNGYRFGWRWHERGVADHATASRE